MKILFICMINSVHAARWIQQLQHTNHKILIFPSILVETPHELLKNYHIYFPVRFFRKVLVFLGLQDTYILFITIYLKIIKKDVNYLLLKSLKKCIKTYQPHLVHSLETQHAGYLTLSAKQEILKYFPLWWHSNWGSDIYLFARLNTHRKKIQKLLKFCDFYSCECARDVDLAIKYDLNINKVLGVVPNSGGFDINQIQRLRKKCKPTSKRKVILVKGYQSWAGRSLCILKALSFLQKELQGYQIIVYLGVTEDILIATELLQQDLKIPIKVLPYIAHEEMLAWHGRARISIAASISDAASISMLESMAMGAFPIQSYTACVSEWLINHKTGIFIPPEEPNIIAKAIKKALQGNLLVDNANKLNWNVIQNRLDYNIVGGQVLSMYEKVITK